MPLRKVIVGNEGDDDNINKKSINDALSWFGWCRNSTLIHFPQGVDLQLLWNINNNIMAVLEFHSMTSAVE